MSKSIISKILITILAIMLICSFFASQNTHHIDTCHDEDCPICSIIHFAQVIINLAIVLFLIISAGFLIQYFIVQKCKKQERIDRTTLVYLKVQLNN